MTTKVTSLHSRNHPVVIALTKLEADWLRLHLAMLNSSEARAIWNALYEVREVRDDKPVRAA